MKTRSLSFEPLEGRALLSAVTPVTHAPALVQTVPTNQKLYALTKGILDTVYNGIEKVLVSQITKAQLNGNTSRATILQNDLNQVTSWYNQDLAVLQQRFGMS